MQQNRSNEKASVAKFICRSKDNDKMEINKFSGNENESFIFFRRKFEDCANVVSGKKKKKRYSRFDDL